MLNQQQPQQEAKPALKYRPASISLGGLNHPRPTFSPQTAQAPQIHFMKGVPQPILGPFKLKNQDALVPTQHTLKKSSYMPSETTLKKHSHRGSSNFAVMERETIEDRVV